MADISEDEKRLRAEVTVFLEGRDLLTDPPGADETLEHIGVPGDTLDNTIRDWINRNLRAPKKFDFLLSGDLTTDMTWEDFSAKAREKGE